MCHPLLLLFDDCVAGGGMKGWVGYYGVGVGVTAITHSHEGDTSDNENHLTVKQSQSVSGTAM